MLLMLDKPHRPAAGRFGALISHAAHAAFEAIDAVALWPFRVAENRRIMGGLVTMSDHDLRDIGLTRGDLRDATALPASADPSRFLDRRRRAGRRADD